MCYLFKKVSWKPVLISGFIYFVIAFILRQIEAVLTMKYYLMPEYFPVWSKLMMSTAGPPPPIFMLLSSLFTFFTGVVLAAFYSLIRDLLPSGRLARIYAFTCLTAVLLLVLSYLPLYLLINLPLSLLAVWFVTSTVSVFFGSLIFARLIR